MRTLHRYCFGTMVSLAASIASADSDPDYFGLLRARDISPFGFLRLDMRPAHAVIAPEGTWAIETELAYQNTWALSQVAQFHAPTSGH